MTPQPERYQRSPAWLFDVILIIFAGLLVAAWALLLWVGLTTTAPKTFELHDGGATARIETANARLLLESDCFDVAWSFEQIQGVKLNEAATIGFGETTVCGRSADFEVFLQDGTTRLVRFVPDVVMGSGLLIQLPVFSVALVLWAFIRRKRRAARATYRTQIRPRADSPPRISDAVCLWAVVLITLVGAALRTGYLDLSIRGDEAWTVVDFTSLPLDQALSRYDSTNNHLLHTFFQYFAYHGLGNNVVWLRLPVLFASLLAVAAAYQAGRSLYNRPVGLLAAVMMTGLPIISEFAVNARGFAFQLLILLLLIALIPRAVGVNRPRYWLLVAVLLALGFYTMPLMLYPAGVLGIWLFANLLNNYRGSNFWARARWAVGSLALGAVLTLILYLPTLPYFFSQTDDGLAYDSLSLAQTMTEYASLLPTRMRSTWNALTRDMSAGTLVFLVGGFVLSLFAHRRLARWPFSLAAAALVWLVPLHYAVRGLIVWRAYLFLVPIVALMACAGWVWLLRQRVGVPWQRRAVTIAILGVGALMVSDQYYATWPGLSYDTVPNGAAIASYLVETYEPDRAVIGRHPTTNVLRYYLSLDGSPEALATIPQLATRLRDDSLPETIYIVIKTPQEGVEQLIDWGNVPVTAYTSHQMTEAIPNVEFWLMRRLAR